MIGMQKMPDTLTQETPINAVIIEMLLEMEIHEALEEAVAEIEADEETRMVDIEELVVLGDQKEEKEAMEGENLLLDEVAVGVEVVQGKEMIEAVVVKIDQPQEATEERSFVVEIEDPTAGDVEMEREHVHQEIRCRMDFKIKRSMLEIS